MESGVILQSISVDQLLAKVRDVVKEEIKNSSRKSEQENQILTLPEAAKFLKKSHATVYRLTSTSILPFFKKGNSLYFDRKELEAWIRSGKRISVEQI